MPQKKTKKNKKGPGRPRKKPTSGLTPEEIADIKKAQEEAKEYEEKVLKPKEEQEQIEAKAEFDSIISSERELLKLFSTERFKIQVIYDKKLLNFTITPVKPGDDLSYLELDQLTYMDFTDEEKTVLDKMAKGEATDEDMDVLMKKASSKNKDMAEQAINIMIRVLANYVTPPDFNGDIDARMKFWETQVDINLRTFLATVVMDRLGLSFNKTAQLFQGS